MANNALGIFTGFITSAGVISNIAAGILTGIVAVAGIVSDSSGGSFACIHAVAGIESDHVGGSNACTCTSAGIITCGTNVGVAGEVAIEEDAGASHLVLTCVRSAFVIIIAIGIDTTLAYFFRGIGFLIERKIDVLEDDSARIELGLDSFSHTAQGNVGNVALFFFGFSHRFQDILGSRGKSCKSVCRKQFSVLVSKGNGGNGVAELLASSNNSNEEANGRKDLHFLNCTSEESISNGKLQSC
jgi:hypothetical protein